MPKSIHEIRDPIHVFIRLDSHERKVLDSHPFQRLRYIHQLALTYLIYPGATHRRFEHSLGVMELASRVFDVLFRRENITDVIKEALPEICYDDSLRYWRRVIRMAALCHDIGHLPFSHAAEKELLPEGWDHEQITKNIILSDEMKAFWTQKGVPPITPEHIVKLAIGPKKTPNLEFTPLETILSEIIVGDAFGVDRMDYLLRDSHHLGVAYGKFDHYRLIDTIRILPIESLYPDGSTNEFALGVEEGGLQSAEALLFARYFMFSQVYMHHGRRIYDIHLKDFLKEWLPGRFFSTDINKHIAMTDNEITAALLEATLNDKNSLHELARRIICHKHFKVLYQRNPEDININPEAGQAIYEKIKTEFDPNKCRHDRYSQKSGPPEFPVQMATGEIVSSLAISKTLNHIPVVSIDYIFVEDDIRIKAKKWLEDNKSEIIQLKTEETGDE